MSHTFKMDDIKEREHRVVRALLPPECLSVLTQVRRTMQIQDDLVPSILEHGQQTPGVAAALTKKEAPEYLDQINAIYRTRHSMMDLVRVTIDRKVYYLVLAAGHRRHQTCIWINAQITSGADISYTEKYTGKYRVELRFGLTAKEAIALQFNENRHASVPPHEEARAAWDFWRWLQSQEPELTVTRFGRIIGRTPDWVRSAMRFCTLPDSVQGYVDGRTSTIQLPYGVLVEVARLADGYKLLTNEELSEEAHHAWIRKAIMGRLDATKFGHMISEYLTAKREEIRGQYSLFGTASATDEERRPVRRVVAPDLVRSLWTYLQYWKALEALRKTGGFGAESFIGPEYDPHVRDIYSPASPIHLLASNINFINELVPHLAELARREGGRHRRAIVGSTGMLTEALSYTKFLEHLERGTNN